MSGDYNQVGVRTVALATILRRETERRGGEDTLIGGGGGAGNSYRASLSEEIHASGLMNLHAAKRRIYAILNSETQLVSLNTADKILTALHLNELWHTELADQIVYPGKPEKMPPNAQRKRVGNCVGCGCCWSTQTVGCRSCATRLTWRKKRAVAVSGSLGGRPTPKHGQEELVGRVSDSDRTELKEAA